MAKSKTRVVFVCQNCQFESLKWLGKCSECGEYNSFQETVKVTERSNGSSLSVASLTGASPNKPQSIAKIQTENFKRIEVPIGEFARVLGGGIVPGSITLISGDPGIGKSTLLLQVTAELARTQGKVLYVSAEESINQIKLRAERLELAPEDLYLLSETNLNLILDHIEEMNPVLVIIDSIQTVYLTHKERNVTEDYGFGLGGDSFGNEMTSAAGSVTQVRECAATLMRLSKKRGIPIFLVGHVTKEGNIAGPRVLEHMVDCVLYLEGDRFHQYRLLRGVKNRFGSTNEVGVFEMSGDGMVEVSNPSEVFLAERTQGAPGSGVAVTLEGTRPLLVEVQALCSQCYTQVPRRTANGIDMNRLLMLNAVLSKRVGVPLGGQDVYVNVVGGLKITEPAADLSIATAIFSSYREAEIEPNMVLIGEVGLSGEVRMVSQLERRLAEAAKLGFTKAVYPRNSKTLTLPPGFEGYAVSTLDEALEKALIPNASARSGKSKRKNANTPAPAPPKPVETEPATRFDEYGNELNNFGDELELSDLDEF
jgi:DNA repair protein RadA/Sms